MEKSELWFTENVKKRINDSHPELRHKLPRLDDDYKQFEAVALHVIMDVIDARARAVESHARFENDQQHMA
jgi:hypothetical protein